MCPTPSSHLPGPLAVLGSRLARLARRLERVVGPATPFFVGLQGKRVLMVVVGKHFAFLLVVV